MGVSKSNKTFLQKKIKFAKNFISMPLVFEFDLKYVRSIKIFDNYEETDKKSIPQDCR